MKKLTEQDFKNAAVALGIDVASVKAVTEVESAGSGFLADGRVKVQYEPHIMYRQLKEKFNQARADEELRKHPDLVAKSAGSYQSLDKEDKDMDRASKLIDRESALKSASWGMFQILGLNYKQAGYVNLQAFINAMYKGEAGHLEAFVGFIKGDKRLHDALKSKDWTQFARIYNGPAYAKNKYDIKLKAAYDKYSKM